MANDGVRRRRQRGLLGAGALLGAALAAYGVARPAGDAGTLPDNAAAIVNGIAIDRARLREAMAALDKGGKRAPSLSPREVAQRLVEEELLLQRAIALGLMRRDPALRASLSAAVIAAVIAESDSDAPGPTTEVLRAHHAAHRSLFRRPALLRLEQVCFSDTRSSRTPPMARAAATRQKIKPGDTLARRSAGSDPCPVPLPDALLPPTKLLDYLGPTATRSALELRPGQTSQPIRTESAVMLLRLLERRGGDQAPFEQVRAQVERHYRKQRDDRRLRGYLESLKETAEIRLAVVLQ